MFKQPSLGIWTAIAVAAWFSTTHAQPERGTWRIDLGLGIGFHYGDETEFEEDLTEGFGLVLSGNDTASLDYSYTDISVELSVAAYLARYFGFGIRYAYHGTMESTKYDQILDDPDGVLLHVNELGFLALGTSKALGQAFLEAQIGSGVGFGSLTRLPILSSTYSGDLSVAATLDRINRPVSLLGTTFMLQFGVLMLGKHGIGGARIGATYEAMYLHLMDDTVPGYYRNITCQNLKVALGALLML